MTTLTVNTTTDFTTQTLAGIDSVAFGIINDFVMATFSAGQFDGVQISPACHFDSGTAFTTLYVDMGGGAVIDGSGWTFANWTDPDYTGTIGFSDHILLNGSVRNDTIIGTSHGDEFYGMGGDDVMSGGGGDDLFMTGMAEGSDDIRGGAGVDLLNLSRAMTSLDLTIDISHGGGGADIGDGTRLATIDRLALVSGTGNDVIIGRQYSDRVDGNAGNDFLDGRGGSNFLFGAEGNDIVVCSGTDGEFSGGSGSDTLILYRATSDLAFSLDLHTGLSEALADGNTVFGDFERLKFKGGSGDDDIVGASKANQLSGGGGDDSLIGGDRADRLSGGDGADVLTGGLGADQLSGGAGNDSFAYWSIASSSAAQGIDTITDFDAHDVIDLRGIDPFPGGIDDSFSFIGSANFAVGTAGTLRAVQEASRWVIEGEVNGDAVADLVIYVNVNAVITETSFLF